MVKTTEIEEKPDCLPCRLIGGGGLTAAGIYVASQVPKQGKFPAKVVVTLFAGGLVYTGVARLCHFPPFRRDSHNSSTAL